MSTDSEILAQLIAAQTHDLKIEIEQLRLQLRNLTSTHNVTEFETQSIAETIQCNETLDIIKSLPEFNGKGYVSWREAAHNTISLYVKGSRKYFAALTILRNKITQEANDTLTNHGTVLNFEAIISRLDFAYADKRPLHILEQELNLIRQTNLNLVDYYNKVNSQLTLMINKTIMTYGNSSEITKEYNKRHRSDALRVFITGLNYPLNNILMAINPTDLPNALAKAQEMEYNQIRIQFANEFSQARSQMNRNRNSNNNNKNFPKPNSYNQHSNSLRFDQRAGQQNNSYRNFGWQNQPKPEPMEVDSSGQFKQQTNSQPRQNTYKPNYQSNNNPEERTPKRSFGSGNSHQPQPKQQRINNIQENAFLDEATPCLTYSDNCEAQTEN